MAYFAGMLRLFGASYLILLQLCAVPAAYAHKDELSVVDAEPLHRQNKRLVRWVSKGEWLVGFEEVEELVDDALATIRERDGCASLGNRAEAARLTATVITKAVTLTSKLDTLEEDLSHAIVTERESRRREGMLRELRACFEDLQIRIGGPGSPEPVVMPVETRVDVEEERELSVA